MRFNSLFLLALLIIVPVFSVKAQDSTPEVTPESTSEAGSICSLIIQNALEAAARECASTGINEICYGSGALELTPRVSGEIEFAASGDRADVGVMQQLSLLPFSVEREAYSVAVLRPRIDLPEGALTMLAFGEVTLQNISDAESDFLAREVLVRRGAGANVRDIPDEAGSLIGTYFWGQALTAIGRTQDGAWLRVIAEGQAGWVSADLVIGDFDFALLNVDTPDDAPVLYAPMQTFDLRTSVFDAPCTELDAMGSESGLLIQTPNLARSARLVINNFPVSFTGTLYLQTLPDTLQINVLEGEAEVGDIQIGTLTLAAGQLAQVLLDADGLYAQYPDTAEEYSYVRARNTPLALLPRPINLPFSLVGVLQAFEPNTGFLQSLPADGQCVVAWSAAVNLRSGPGTQYPIRESSPAGFAAQPDARAVGLDGVLWWRLAEGIWVNSNGTAIAGVCGLLPVIDPPPLP